MNVPYEIWDVFTNTPLQGNPLAVIPNATELSDGQMQAIAKEFNLSETSFILPSEKAHFRARYFTPSRELPMAGHPTIGSIFSLYHLGKINVLREVSLELAAGIFPIRLEYEGGQLSQAWMEQGIPKVLAEVTDRQAVAHFLNFQEGDLMDLPLQVISAGNPFFMIPVKSLEALSRIQLSPNLSTLQGHKLVGALVFTLKNTDALVQCRMLAVEGTGVDEDPATGSAHGPLGWYLATHGMLEVSEVTSFTSHQGLEMGRPSVLQVQVKNTSEGFSVAVGGQAVLVGEGVLYL